MGILYNPTTGEYADEETGELVNQEAATTGPFKAALIGAGRTVQNVGEGLGLLDPVDEGTYMDDLRTVNPISTALGEIAPGFIGPMRMGLAGNAAFGALSGYLTSDEENRGAGAAMGAGGAGAGDIIGRVLGRLGNLRGATKTTAGPPADLEAAGYKLTPAQKSGSQAQLKVERGLEKNPWNQGKFAEIGEHNEALLESRMNKAIGLPEGNGPLNRSARTIAAEQIGDGMEQVAEGVVMDVPESLSARVSKIIANDEMLEIPQLPDGGQIDGGDYMRIRSDLADAERSSQGSAQRYIKNTIKQMDEQFLDVAGEEQAGVYRVLREQYKNLSLFEKGSVLTPDGQINIKSAGNAFRSKQGYGKRSIDNTLDATKQLIDDMDNLSSKAVNPYIGNSGTPEGTSGILNLLNAASSLGTDSYLRGGWGLGNLKLPATQGAIGLGANIGRGSATGLLGQQQ